jgi:hypothetical protein
LPIQSIAPKVVRLYHYNGEEKIICVMKEQRGYVCKLKKLKSFYAKTVGIIPFYFRNFDLMALT